MDFGVDVALLATGLGAEAWERPLLDLLPYAGQISRGESFTTAEFARGVTAALSFQTNLELFLGAQILAHRAPTQRQFP